MSVKSLLTLSSLSLLGLVAASTIGCSKAADTPDDTGDQAATVAAGPATLPSNWSSMSAADKYELMTTQRLATSKYPSIPKWSSPDLIGIARVDLSVTLNRDNDEMPAGRKKLVHTLGSCAGAELVPVAGNPYSGMYKSGGKGIVRLSLATDPGTDNYTPGLALKIFIDGVPSANIESMYSIDGQGADFNFFSNRFSNIIAAPTKFATNIIGDIFKEATPFPNFLDATPFGRYDNAGTLTNPPVSPYQIFWIPTDEVKAVGFYSSPNVDFRQDLARIPAGTPIYNLVGSATKDGALENIAQLVTRTEMASSTYCDQQLFFKHPEATTAP